jgi:hypothetical protein
MEEQLWPQSVCRYNPFVPIHSTWRLRDTLTALTLFLACAAFTLWQNAHIAVLWDLAYLLDSSYRFSLGQLPYRNLPFSHPPLTFLIQAAIIHLFGRAYWHHTLYAALSNGAATLLTWRITLRLLPNRWLLATLLCTTLVPLGIYSIYPHPIYDSDCLLAVLFALYLLLRTEGSIPDGPDAPSIPRPLRDGWDDAALTHPRNLLAGAVCVLPLFFKQNIGLLFLAATLASLAVILIVRRLRSESIAPQLTVLAGAALALLAALVALHLTVGLANYRYWTLTFAAQRRLPGLSTLLGVYHQPSLLWTVPTSLAALLLLRNSRDLPSRTKAVGLSGEIPTFVFGIAVALLIAPFAYAAFTFFLADGPSDRGDAILSLWPHLLLLAAIFALYQLQNRPTPLTLLPLILLAIIHGTFLSQQLWGSTYALWPVLVLLLVLILREAPLDRLATPLIFTITATFLVCGTLYALSLDRLSYNHLEGTLTRATLPSLRGMAIPGPYLPNFEQLVRTTDALIPPSDGIVLLPGQEPFYFATGRTPRFPILLLDPATNPYSPTQLRDEARHRDIQWLIVNTNLQLMADPITDLPDYINTLLPDFTLVRTLPGYTVYHRNRLPH